MTPDRWQQIKHVLDRVDAAPLADRRAILSQACAGDADLAREVESLLNYESRAEVLDRAVPTTAGVPSRIGSYRVERLLGAGGMGAVYLAQRDDDYRKQVAIKVIPAAADPELLARFRAERQIVAALDHPYIARLLDGGALPDGRPYFVMEHITGQRIDDYVAQEKLDTAAVLRLFLKVCAAVHFAHQNLVVHRDLKAGNILVSENGDPHLLDFGIAKVLDPAAQTNLERTHTLHRRLTPIAASPEHVAGGPITTATDVYSLGILLYRLLTGVSPYAGAKDFTIEAARVIREYEPPRPSEAPGVPPKLRRILAGDLDNIVGKAIAKEPARRYTTLSDLAADIQRYLEGWPVEARPVSFLSRARKFAGRNRLMVTAAMLLLLAIAGGLAGTLWYAHQARLEQARAERRFAALRKLTNSLLFEVRGSIVNLVGATAARELLVKRALEYLDQMSPEAHGDPGILHDLAVAYDAIAQIWATERQPHLGGPGALARATELEEKALAIRKKLADGDPGNRQLKVDYLDTLWYAGGMYRSAGDLDRALSIERQRLDLVQKLAARDPAEDYQYFLTQSLNHIGELLRDMGSYPAAMDFVRRGLAVSQVLLDANPASDRARRRVGISHDFMGYVLESQGRFSEAVGEHYQALAEFEQVLARDPLNSDKQRMIAQAQEYLCQDLARSGAREAPSHCEKALALLQGMVKADKDDVQANADLASVDTSMSLALQRMRQTHEALAWEQKARLIYRDLTPRNADSIEIATSDARSLSHLGELEAVLQQPDRAREHLAQARDALDHLLKLAPKDKRIQNSRDYTVAAFEALPNTLSATLPPY